MYISIYTSASSLVIMAQFVIKHRDNLFTFSPCVNADSVWFQFFLWVDTDISVECTATIFRCEVSGFTVLWVMQEVG